MLSQHPKTSDRHVSRRREYAVSAVVLVLFLALAAGGWHYRDRLAIDPGAGRGYWLGIVGTSFMVALLGYPLRKRIDRLPGSVKTWFRIHMLFGLLGPLAILYHATFRWHALNSLVALTATLVVLASGIVGRFLHLHLYAGYDLHRLVAADLAADLHDALNRMESDLDEADPTRARLEWFEGVVAQRPRTLIAGMRLWLWVAFATARESRTLRHTIARHLNESARQNGWTSEFLTSRQAVARADLKEFLARLRTTAAFGTYERLFRYWHLLHVPMFGLLTAAAILHIVAVHRY